MIPSAVTEAEVAELQRLATGRMVLEVGSLLGYSTVRLAEVATRVVAVDPHSGYPTKNPRPTLVPFLGNLGVHGVRDKVTVMVGYDYEVLPFLAPRTFDLAFIDCTGEYKVTLGAMRRCKPLLRHYAALAVHDCGHPDWPGAMEAVEAFGWEIGFRKFRLIDRLAIFEGTWG